MNEPLNEMPKLSQLEPLMAKLDAYMWGAGECWDGGVRYSDYPEYFLFPVWVLKGDLNAAAQCAIRAAPECDRDAVIDWHASVNRDPSQYTWVDDRYDEKLLMFLIDHLLLDKPSPLPMAANVPAGIATELQLQHVVGAGRSTEATPKKITLPEIFGWLWHWLLFLIRR